jgi:hypothetical protein
MSKVPQTIPELYEAMMDGFFEVGREVGEIRARLVIIEDRLGGLEKEARLTRRAVQNLETQLLPEKERVLPAREYPRSATSRHHPGLAAKQRD